MPPAGLDQPGTDPGDGSETLETSQPDAGEQAASAPGTGEPPVAALDSTAGQARAEGAVAAEPQPAHGSLTPPAAETLQESSNGADKPVVDLEDRQPLPARGAEPVGIAEPPVAEALSVEALIESLLFVADGAVPIGRLAEALEVSNRDVEAALAALGESYRQRGLSLQRFRDKAQLTTSPSAAAQVERFLGLAAATPLSRAALETLAIVAYQQPVTRPQVEAVRGVNSDSVIKNLLSKGLIEESGRAEGPGRPVLYSTTPEFMQHFGLASLTDLPPLSLPGAESTASSERIEKGQASVIS